LLEQDKIDLQSVAKQLIGHLKEYAVTHFAHEEEYMKKINDPELPRQKHEHQAFVKKVNSFTIDSSLQRSDVEKLLQYMVRWLFNHILSSDMMIGKAKASAEEDPFAFTAKYETGVGFIDSEHETLFSIIREANDLIHAEFLHDKYDEILNILDKLRVYTEQHFYHEEEYMKKISYPKLEAQQRAHNAFIEKLVHIDINDLDSIDDNQQQYLIELIDYLLDWLSTHILHSDRLIGKWAKENNKETK
jgi:hemerythrin